MRDFIYLHPTPVKNGWGHDMIVIVKHPLDIILFLILIMQYYGVDTFRQYHNHSIINILLCQLFYIKCILSQMK